MIEQETRPCSLGLASATLSALRDEALPAAELRRLQEHAATCEPCQTRLAGFERIQRALRRQPDLEPGNRIWLGLQERAMNSSTGNSHHRVLPPTGLSATALRGLAAVASIALVVGLLGIVLANAAGNRPGATLTPTVAHTTPTATADVNDILPGPQLSWQQLPTTPSGNLVMDPTDGADGYVCAVPSAGESSVHIYVTRDSGQTWERAGNVSVGINPQPSTTAGKPDTLYCQLSVDESAPTTAVVATTWATMGASPPPEQYTSFATFDFGSHWQQLPVSNAVVAQLATWQGHIYAYRNSDTSSSAQTLWVSNDQMVSWQVVHSFLNPLQSFWLNPTNGALLVQMYGPNMTGSQFYTSTDGGAHWAALQALAMGPSTQWVVQWPVSDGPWQICEYVNAEPNQDSPPQPNTLECTADGGQHWATRTALSLLQNSSKGFMYTAPMFAFAIADDGAVLATLGNLAPLKVYRLPSGASVWQDLGPQPTPSYSGPQYFLTPLGSLLWDGGYSGAYTATYPGI